MHEHTEAVKNSRHYEDNIFKSIFVYKPHWIDIPISVEFVFTVPVTNMTALNSDD